MTEIEIRDGRPEDAPVAALLIREAGDRLMDFLAGFRGRAATEEVLEGLWNLPGTRFSREAARVALTDGEPAGILVGYPREAMAGLDLGTGRALLGLRGLALAAGVLRHPVLTWRMSTLPEAEPGDWYICVLATREACRGRGIGAALLSDAESRARRHGAAALSLMVSEGNAPARSLYVKFGFEERGRFTVAGRTSLRMGKALEMLEPR
ncbi:MAG TPA: GNAT family N-acetyltransferase [Spirochaetia bacterium]|nr:GNAT family N-acetyltransferase [Spirochaetales bacterium]HRY79067.1 GNAT family N-acetyltransferase [Spirochaetia bacterium]